MILDKNDEKDMYYIETEPYLLRILIESDNDYISMLGVFLAIIYHKIDNFLYNIFHSNSNSNE